VRERTGDTFITLVVTKCGFMNLGQGQDIKDTGFLRGFGELEEWGERGGRG
jgi:hypothetical protein